MKIRRKITLGFVALSALLLLAIFFFIYYSTKKYTDKEFYLRLRQRASIAMQAHIDEDEQNISIYDDIRKKHLQTLPNEKEVIYKIDIENKKILGEVNELLPSIFFEEVFSKKYAETKVNDVYYTGLLFSDIAGDFIVEFSANDLYGKAKMRNLKGILIIAYFVSLLFLYVLGQYYSKQVLDPIITIINKVNSIRAKNLYQRLDPGNNNDELAELALTFNAMLDRLETSFEMQSNFMHNASHELKNPLTAILGQTEVGLQNIRTEKEYIDILQTIEKEALRLNNLINGLLNLVHTDNDKKGIIIEPIRVDELILDIKKDIDITYPDNDITIDFSQLPPHEDLLIMNGNLNFIRIVIYNVLDNAIKFSDNKKVKLWLKTTSENIEINTLDKGIGIPSNEIKNIYEPFFRASNVRGVKGFGFGLPLSSKIIKMHGGTIEVTSEVEKETLVRIIFPNKNQSYNVLK
ncbi:HAMP domain-containing histidine kinase [Cellulophaga sp. HaHaR_3_176]|uniref:sensor histidine kinase n=1 Tax=Cellulophaga sp. HaHaR_3_176 TaxID=1942464 RepID=UPI001C1FDF61|nr:HAMP domain-containing sensor histidine kinase [Cellulophaga sp. HaHaR_3_176]QWX82612.1 HAMP domain-containing histidine kinase [Cellulophaga sp. HaHaR_3_176]